MGHSVSILNFNGQIISDIERIADTLGESFAKISSEETYPQEFIKYKRSEEKKNLTFRSSSTETYNGPFALHELKIALSKSHPTSPGPDKIHSNLLKNLSESSLRVLLILFNRIWLEEYFPVTWRKAVVIPIPKPGKDPQIPTNYRPIALTSCLCKLMERMVNARLVHVLEENGFLSNFQSGFRYGRGTIDNVLMLETAIRDAFVTKKHLVSVFFDMDKAYDRTWRYGILKDMYNMGFRGKLPIFIKNFLMTRTFQVRIGDILSQNFQQYEGVPQGSVLSVILFIIKLNGIIHHLPQYVHGSLYVDDLQIYCASVNMSFIERQLQTAVRNITCWANKNGFLSRVKKTNLYSLL
ncbi:putative RNA-directed DNA polymerase from transposon X-element [Araneus ventricosus]|uniref:Putative RNA-directed DNA polymerase from transposon X-element n=1 Tax=Araneus ventricosus TaxID=182803 RepID=A0A4Y2SYT7_ARAVE|nr:putative RNA-directed DNA polymerase from transposon X-element [Araneus ventricosus]